MNSLDSFRKPVHNKCMGIEIECLFGGTQKIPNREHSGFFYFTEDYSIEAKWFQISREIVSQPLPADMLMKEITRLEKRVGAWGSNDSCGIHVHVSRTWLSEKKAQAIYNWLKTQSLEDIKLWFGREPNSYCTMEKPSQRTRYTNINITNKATIEFRMFASGMACWARYCVEMARYMVDNCYRLNTEAFHAASDMFKAKHGV